MGATAAATVFISYRRSAAPAVDELCALLAEHGIEPWLDRTAIDELEDFPQRIRDGIASSHAVIVWWSADYAASDLCMQEFRLAWQYARQRSSRVGDRIWILNPEDSAAHICAGDIAVQNHMEWRPADQRAAWGARLATRLAGLLPTGTLAATSDLAPRPAARGTPLPAAPLTGRGACLMQIHSALFAPAISLAAAAPMVQLAGLAGIGKTAVAATYANEFALAYPGGIWWFNMAGWVDADRADDGATLEAWLRALQQLLRGDPTGLRAQLAEGDDGRPVAPAIARERLARVLASSNQPYLWVLDNLPQGQTQAMRDEALMLLRAPTALGCTLVTSRDARQLAGATLLRLPALSPGDGSALLARYLRPEQRPPQRAAIAAIVAEVGAHPLALVLLGRQLATQAIDGARLLRQLRQLGALTQLEQLHEDQQRQLGDGASGVLAAVQLSLEPLDAGARRLLALASACSAYLPIPMDLLERAFGGDAGGRQFTGAIAALKTASLVEQPGGPQRQATVHGLVAAVALHEARHTAAADTARLGDALLARFAGLDASAVAFADLAADVPHAAMLLRAMDGENGVRLATSVAEFHLADGDARQALQSARAAVQRAPSCCTADDRTHLLARSALSAAMAECGDLNAAAAMQRELLDEARVKLGAGDPDTLTLWSRLADTRLRQGHRLEAEAEQRGLLAAVRKLRGDHDGQTLSAANALAAMLYAQHRFDEARTLQLDVLSLATQCGIAGVAGAAEGADAMVALGNLAATELALGHVDEAIRLQRQVLASSRKLYPSAHPTLRTHAVTLADALAEDGQSDEACRLYEEVLSGQTQTLGAQHPERLSTLGRLIVAQLATAQPDTADDLLDEFVASVAPTLPAGHPQSLQAVEGLADSLRALGLRIDELGPLLAGVLDARIRDLGEDHLDTIHARLLLSSALADAGRWPQVVDLRRLALDASLRVLGDAHAGTAAAMVGLAQALRQAGYDDDATAMEIEAEDCLVRACGPRRLH